MAYASGRGDVTFERQRRDIQVICMHNQVLVAPNQLVRVGRNRVLMTEACTKSLAKTLTENTKKERLF